MECPYCKKEMKQGIIPRVRDRLIWQGEYNRETFSLETVALQKYGLATVEDAPAHYCPDCRVVIVPVPEFEKPEDMIRRKWNSFTEKMNARREASETRREEEKREKRNEKRRKKDPWEID